MLFAFIAIAFAAAAAGLSDFAGGELEEKLGELEDEIKQELEDFDVDGFVAGLRGGDNAVDPSDRVPTTAGTEQTIEGSDGADTLTGDAGDADVLLGFEGEDVLQLRDENIGTGGEGRDIFDLYAGSDAVITDFVPGEDSLRVNANEILLFQNPAYAMDWRTTDAGVELHYVSEGAIGDGAESRIVTLEGLDTPPPNEDVTLVVYDEIQDETYVLIGDEINFAQRLEGTSGDDAFVLNDAYSEYELATGEGDDRVEFDSFRGVTDLGAGDDFYQSRTEVSAGNPFLDPSETVMGGDGNDVIIGGEAGFIAQGGAGDDTITVMRSGDADIFYARIDGGPGNDTLTFAEHTAATGGEGADSFLITPLLQDRDAPSQITDFDPSEDSLVIQLDENYQGAGELSLAVADYGYGSAILVDGIIAVQFVENLTDLTSVVVVR